MSKFNKLLQEQLKDPEFKKEWDALQPERDLMGAMIKASTEPSASAFICSNSEIYKPNVL